MTEKDKALEKAQAEFGWCLDPGNVKKLAAMLLAAKVEGLEWAGKLLDHTAQCHCDWCSHIRGKIHRLREPDAGG